MTEQTYYSFNAAAEQAAQQQSQIGLDRTPRPRTVMTELDRLGDDLFKEMESIEVVVNSLISRLEPVVRPSSGFDAKNAREHVLAGAALGYGVNANPQPDAPQAAAPATVKMATVCAMFGARISILRGRLADINARLEL